MPTLEELENEVWPDPEFDSYLVTTCHRLRRKPIEDFTTEDLRIMIGQNLGLPFLLPKALIILEDNPFAEGDYYPGDLLVMVTSVKTPFFIQSPGTLARVLKVTKLAINLLRSSGEDADLLTKLQQFMDKNA